MTTLKEHQAAMVDLLANGSGIPASASRLAHAMHDLIEAHLAVGTVTFTHPDGSTVPLSEINGFEYVEYLQAATTPGLNEKALSKPVTATKTDSHATRPAPAEIRVKELENTCGQLRNNLRTERSRVAELEAAVSLLQEEILDLRGLGDE